MAGTKTKPTRVDPKAFIAAVPNETRRKDAQVLLKLFERVTGWKARMWGPTIVGFGRYDYTYDTGHSGSVCVAGFSPRGASLVLYLMPDKAKTAPLLNKLGKHKGGDKSCLYINKLADVDMAVLEKLVGVGVAAMQREAKARGWPVSPA